jgi:hypothetical protein
MVEVKDNINKLLMRSFFKFRQLILLNLINGFRRQKKMKKLNILLIIAVLFNSVISCSEVIETNNISANH